MNKTDNIKSDTAKQNSETNNNNSTSTKIFLSLPVKDLKKAMDFFGKLEFKFNPMFTDENAACMVISEDIYAMLLVEKFFKSFIPNKEICDAKRNTEALIALSTKSREEVDSLIKKALAAGASEYRQAQDYGWMYGRAFQDIDGHIWEIFHADLNAMPEEMKKKGQGQ
jgi:predicted lactoylglutathione lyase